MSAGLRRCPNHEGFLADTSVAGEAWEGILPENHRQGPWIGRDGRI
jgi:hypothetical protein